MITAGPSVELSALDACELRTISAMRNIWPHLAGIKSLYRSQPETAKAEIDMIKVEAKIARTVREYHMAAKQSAATQPAQKGDDPPKDEKVEAAAARLRELVGQRFDLHLKRSELRIQELEGPAAGEIPAERVESLDQEERHQPGHPASEVEVPRSRQEPGQEDGDVGVAAAMLDLGHGARW